MLLPMLPTPMLTTESPTAMARGRLRPSPRLMAMATDPPTDMDTDMPVPTPTMAMARGLLRPSPRPMAMATDPPTDTHMPVPTPTVAMAVDTTGDKSSDHDLTRLWTTDQCSICLLL